MFPGSSRYSMTAKIRRIKFTEQEDSHLRALVSQFGVTNWNLIASQMPGRIARQCRDRWNHHVTPRHGSEQWTPDEDRLLIQRLQHCGPRWSDIAAVFPNRKDIAVRNHCYRLARQEDDDDELDAYQSPKIKADIVDARELQDIEHGKQTLPSCLSLMMSMSVAPNATKLYPLNLTL
jgi:hypothetical protein